MKMNRRKRKNIAKIVIETIRILRNPKYPTKYDSVAIQHLQSSMGFKVTAK